jgi:hypothetical protein
MVEMGPSADEPRYRPHGVTQYSALPPANLIDLLLKAHDQPEVRQLILAELSTLTPRRRGPAVMSALRLMVRRRESYSSEVMFSLVDLLATDPTPEATQAMLDVLPAITLEAHHSDTPLSEEFRRYFYEALVTRRRETDLPVWRENIARLEGEVLIGLLVDPAAAPIEQAINPLRLIDRLSDDARQDALTELLWQAPFRYGPVALRMLLGGKPPK